MQQKCAGFGETSDQLWGFGAKVRRLGTILMAAFRWATCLVQRLLCTHTYRISCKCLHSAVVYKMPLLLHRWSNLQYTYLVPNEICATEQTLVKTLKLSDASCEWDSETAEVPPVIFPLSSLRRRFRLWLCAINPFENSLPSSKRVQLTKPTAV